MAFSDQFLEPSCDVSFGETSNVISSTSIDQGLRANNNLEVGLTEVENEDLKIGGSQCKLTLPEFPIDRPWLPPKALSIIDRIKNGPISEGDATSLMQLVAEQVIDHFHLQSGKYFASTLYGRIVETANTNIELLKKLQGQTFEGEIFVWRVGSDSFSGRL
jgi:hypothetical protein